MCVLYLPASCAPPPPCPVPCRAARSQGGAGLLGAVGASGLAAGFVGASGKRTKTAVTYSWVDRTSSAKLVAGAGGANAWAPGFPAYVA